MSDGPAHFEALDVDEAIAGLSPLAAGVLLDRYEDSLHTAILDLQARQDALNFTVRHVRARKNSFKPINSIPNELLLRIFELLDSPASCAQVCEKWRGIVVGTPELWTNVNPPLERCLPFALECSKGLPITIALISDRQPYYAKKLASALLPHIARVQSLRLTATERSLEVLIRTLGRAPTPLLELMQYSMFRDSSHSFLRPPVNLLHPDGDMHLFAGAPKLRSVYLDKVAFFWDSHVFTNLHVLVVTHDSFYHVPLFSEFDEILLANPRLRMLSLSNIAPEDVTRPARDMPELVNVEVLHARDESVADTLAYLAIPNHAKMQLISPRREVGASFRGLFPTDCSRLGPMVVAAHLLINLEVSPGTSQLICRETQDDPSQHSVFATWRSFPVNIVIDAAQEVETLFCSAVDIVELFPNITTIRLTQQGRHWTPAAEWAQLLSAASNLQVLEVDQPLTSTPEAFGLFDAIGDPSLAPRLSRAVLSTMSWQTIDANLVSILLRNRANSAAFTLVLRHCSGGSPGKLEALRSSGASVTVEGMFSEVWGEK